jgi:hypothetical protein
MYSNVCGAAFMTNAAISRQKAPYLFSAQTKLQRNNDHSFSTLMADSVACDTFSFYLGEKFSHST